MKQYIALFMALIMVMSVPVVLAQEVDNTTTDETDNTTIDDETDNTSLDDDAGITPDSPLWGLERAMERVSLMLTFNKAAKAQKGLEHAQERLAEVQVMIQEKKMDKALKAQKSHDETLEKVKKNIKDMGNGDAEGELEQVVEMEKKINEHAAMVERIANTKFKTKGLSEEDRDTLREVVEALPESNNKLQIEVMNKKDSVKIKLKATRDMSEEDIEELEQQIRATVQNGEVKVIGNAKQKGQDGEDEFEVEVEDESDEDEADAAEDAAERAAEAAEKAAEKAEKEAESDEDSDDDEDDEDDEDSDEDDSDDDEGPSALSHKPNNK